MSGLDNKKAKRRKVKKAAVTKAANQIGQKSASAPSDASPTVDHGETLKKLERLMDAEDEASRIFTCANNPFLNKDRCLLCHCERQDPPDVDKIKAALGVSEFDDLQASLDNNPLAQLPLWVCPSCRKAADQEMEKKPSIEQFMEPDLEDSFLSDINIKTGSEPTTPNGSICNCEACTERRSIESELEQETVELQQCWADLRKVVRCLYGCRDNSEELLRSLPDDEEVKERVHKLCRRDPHQLFLRLESQVREFVIEMKVKLLKQLSNGFKTPPQAKTFISMLLEEYAHLCKIARRMSGLLKELQDHLKRFKVTWDLHNKHLFQSIVFSEPSIKNSMNLLTQQLRLGAASKETCHEDTYPNLLHRYLKFEDEMSVINVVWRDCHQLIENYNEEQSVLKLKQKMLREDWELFKTQRKLLEQQVSKNPKATISHNLEAQFTETMRLMLQGNKPSTEELICPRCNSKRCPCDECTITHMITCGIINPEVLDHAASTTGHHHNANFLHDSNKYRIDVSPPSMSSTTSSSGSSSPIMVDPERLKGFSENNPTEEEIQEEIDNQSYEEDEEDDDEDAEDEDEDADNEEEDEEDEPKDEENEDGLPPLKIQNMMKLTMPPLLDPDEALLSGDKLDSCNCDHCVSQSKLEKVMKSEDNQCQCHVCLQQQGKAISTSLPQHIPPIPRPGELHLYPHIHGSSGLHSLGRGHVRPLLQPSLYDLHLPTTQRHKSIIHQAKVPIKLDFDTPEGMNDHIYHAYGDWDNTSYDPRLLLNSGKFDSELLPPPPFSSPYTSSLLSEPLPMSMPGLISSSSGSVISSVSSTSAFTSTFTNHSSAAASIQASTKITDNLSVLTTKESLGEQVSNKFTKCANQSGSPSKNHNPPWVRPATLGGNNVPKVQEKPHSQHCRKHSAQANSKTGTLPNHNHGNQLPMKMTPEFMQSKEGRQMMQLANSLKQPNGNNHPCNHSNKASSHTGGGKDGHQGVGTCANAIHLPTSVNNVSVSTSTVCTEPDCDGNHDDNYDSIDDNCSEKSSSTSNSTSQKEGKYCDCCYCEFFGHGNPPVAPTSKNYAEMRDKLRLRLKKKQTEGKPDDQSIANSNCMIDLHSKKCVMAAGLQAKPQPPPCDNDTKPVETRGLDELINFINGTDQDSQGKQLSQKAAKRARQKQRKANEKKRQEEERLRAEKLEAERKQQEEMMKAAKLQEAAAAAAAAERAKLEGMTKKQKKQAAKQQAKSSIDSTPSTPTAPSNTASHDISSSVSASAQERLAASTSSKTQKKKGKHKEEDGQKLQVNITCEIEHSPNPTVNKMAKLSQPLPSNCLHNSQSASSNTSAKQHKTNNNRPPPQGSSEPTVLPENDNRNKMDIRPNKNKDIGKTVHLGNGDFMKSEANVLASLCPQMTPQQQQEMLVKKKIHLQIQQENKKQLQAAQQQHFQEQIKQQQQLLAQAQKGRRGSGKVTPDIKQQLSNHAEAVAKSLVQQPQNDKQSKTTGKNPSKNSTGTPTQSQSPRIQEQNNNTKQGKVINGSTATQSSQTATQSQSKKARKQADNIQQNAGSNQSPRQTPSPIATPQQNGNRSPSKGQGQVRQPPQGQAKSTDPSSAQDSKKDQGKQSKQEESPPSDQGKSGKNKKMKKKNKGSDINFIDEVFMPKSESDIEDEFEREIEEFKRFCADSTTPVRREKLQVNVNIKDIFAKKKNGLSVGS